MPNWTKLSELLGLSLNIFSFVACTTLLWQGIGRDVIMVIYAVFFSVSVVALSQKNKGKYLAVCMAMEIAMFVMIGLSYFKVGSLNL